MNKLLKILCVIVAVSGCKSKPSQDRETFSSQSSSSSNNDGSPSSYSDENGESAYPDGEYCASVAYSNDNTGYSSSYTLTVQVEDGKLTQIDWPNGGWLDDSHFDPPDVESDGSCSFTADDDRTFNIQIDGEGGCVVNIGSLDDDDSDEEEQLKSQQEDDENERVQDKRRLDEEQREENERQRQLEEERQNEEEESNNEQLNVTCLSKSVFWYELPSPLFRS